MFWLILGLPFLTSVLVFFLRNKLRVRYSHALGSISLAVVSVLMILVAKEFFQTGKSSWMVYGPIWLSSNKVNIQASLLLDSVSVVVASFVALIGFLVQLASGIQSYERKRAARIYSYINFAVAMMLLLVLAENIALIFLSMVGLGLGAYLLIGYWYQSVSNSEAGVKSYVANRIGDIGFLSFLLICQGVFETTSIVELRDLLVASTSIDGPSLAALQWAAFSLLVSIVAKSAFFPLYNWLSDSSATPVSCLTLIHSVTLSAVGIYLFARLNFVFYFTPNILILLTSVGVLTAVIAGTVALVQTDIKKILSYSATSQIGMAAVVAGVGEISHAFVYLLSHFLTYSLLFVTAGNMVSASGGCQNVYQIGGMKKKLPLSSAAFLFASLCAAGVPYFSMFSTKVDFLWSVYVGGRYLGFGYVLFGALFFCSLLTAFYMFRTCFILVFGEVCGDEVRRRESAIFMLLPIVTLVICGMVFGALNVSAAFKSLNIFFDFGLGERWLDGVFANQFEIPKAAAISWSHVGQVGEKSILLSILFFYVLGIGVSGVLAAKTVFNAGERFNADFKKRLPMLYDLLANCYWVDEIYKDVLQRPAQDLTVFLYRVVDQRFSSRLLFGWTHAFPVAAAVLSLKDKGDISRQVGLVIIGIFAITISIFVW